MAFYDAVYLLEKLRLFGQIFLQLAILFRVLENKVFAHLPVPGRVPSLKVNQILDDTPAPLILSFRYLQHLIAAGESKRVAKENTTIQSKRKSVDAK